MQNRIASFAALAASLVMPPLAASAGAATPDRSSQRSPSSIRHGASRASGTRASAEPIELARFVFARSVDSRKPVGEAERFASDGARVYAYLEVANRGAPQRLTVTWKRGRRIQRYTLPVGKSPRWRTWSYLRATKAMRGSWTVTVRDGSGSQLGEKTVTIGSATAGASASAQTESASAQSESESASAQSERARSETARSERESELHASGRTEPIGC